MRQSPSRGGEHLSPDRDTLSAFMDAVAAGDRVSVKAHLQREPSLVHATDPRRFGSTAPIVGAWRNDREMIDLLLDAGANVNAVSDWWAGPFGLLHSVTDRDLAEHLVERGATVDAHAAAKHGWIERLRAIVEAHSSVVHAPGGDGQRPLHFAATPEIAAYLLDRGAEIDARCVDHASTAAQWAAKDRPDVCRFLVDRGAEDDIFMDCAIGAATRVHAQLARDPEQLVAKITPDRFPSPGSEAGHIYRYTLGDDATPLHVAARCDQVEIIHLLIDAGCPPDIVGDYDSCTPLHVAAWNDRVRAAGALLDRGADIERSSGTRHNTSPVCWAIVAGSADMVRFLFDRGARMQDDYLREARGGLSGKRYTAAPEENFARILSEVERRRE